MVLKMQELLTSRGLKPGDVMLIFLEFDTSGDGALNLSIYTASHSATPSHSHTPLTHHSHPHAPVHPSRTRGIPWQARSTWPSSARLST